MLKLLTPLEVTNLVTLLAVTHVLSPQAVSQTLSLQAVSQKLRTLLHPVRPTMWPQVVFDTVLPSKVMSNPPRC